MESSSHYFSSKNKIQIFKQLEQNVYLQNVYYLEAVY